MFIRAFMIFGALLSVLLAGCATTPTVKSGGIEIENEDMRAVIVFSDTDRARIREHYRKTGKSKTMPPGLAKKNKLPPGLQKHIDKNGKLPPGLEGRRLSPGLERSLSRLPSGFVRLQVGGDIVLLNEKTRVVLDVIWDVMQQK
ncbi:hypothetical protein ACFLZ5_05040 [Thermodesulfobacteriota bacterium]